MSKSVIHTDQAPQAIGTYSQAIKCGTTVYLSGQIPLVAETMEMVSEDFAEQAHQVFKNITAVCEAAGGSTADLAKVNIYLTDLGKFATVNEIMSQYIKQPYPARAAVQVSALPRGAQIEIDGVMELPE
ncbi:MAG: RidA family protein [Paraglaciecola sp.]|uniref:RidA family protein n=1 Tax=Pseudomonadati TaxID=3379134 RepID=UPI00273FBACD|nr:RidA family protein [Paraglaciecola sp.]MDP5029654.1 RidA family protein [Paraglaciecola sp.]MDP5040809.1 RidA family protein [Paraglaciecola sp.]MDP5129949.1 RidA family protein [Paraglaciecola sp.]